MSEPAWGQLQRALTAADASGSASHARDPAGSVPALLRAAAALAEGGRSAVRPQCQRGGRAARAGARVVGGMAGVPGAAVAGGARVGDGGAFVCGSRRAGGGADAGVRRLPWARGDRAGATPSGERSAGGATAGSHAVPPSAGSGAPSVIRSAVGSAAPSNGPSARRGRRRPRSDDTSLVSTRSGAGERPWAARCNRASALLDGGPFAADAV
ncbi:unnamed protein product [Closterium sp. Naga37s-1]|nr:unnamed protein product [Closterium sp. Naga37s-1]